MTTEVLEACSIRLQIKELWGLSGIDPQTSQEDVILLLEFLCNPTMTLPCNPTMTPTLPCSRVVTAPYEI